MAKDDNREVVNANNSTPAEQEREILRSEVEKGVEECKLTDSDPKVYINILSLDLNAVYWRPVLCQTCAKPKIVHDPLQTRCNRPLITHSLRIKYEIA